jgi:aspartate/tyrosine/aromatic aminotransferase
MQAEWMRIADVCAAREAVIVFDTAYQGYARRDIYNVIYGYIM